MGIQDRDYMRQSPARQRKESGDQLESFFGNLLKRYPRLPLIATILLAALILAGLLIAFIGD